MKTKEKPKGKKKISKKYLYTFDTLDQKFELQSLLSKEGLTIQSAIKELLQGRYPQAFN